MTDRAISEEAMLTSLRDIRLPAEAAGGLWAELAVAIGLAALAALLLGGVLRLLSLRRNQHGAAPPVDVMAALSDLPEAERRVALLHLLRRRAPERYAQLRDRLYRPSDGLALADLEAEVARHV